jgi:Ca-activated chloride channel homolog
VRVHAAANGGNVLNHQSRGLIVGYPDDLRLRSTNAELLQDFATASDNRFNPLPETIFADTEPAPLMPTSVILDANQTRTAWRATLLWPYLVILATAILLVDVALRRIDFKSVIRSV